MELDGLAELLPQGVTGLLGPGVALVKERLGRLACVGVGGGVVQRGDSVEQLGHFFEGEAERLQY
jgi:hypothetical protein